MLLVEDSSETYELYSEVLAKAGYAVVGADNGDDAYRQAVALAPDLVIMDYELRGPSNSDGWRANRAAQEDPRTAAIPIVMITGHVSASDFERARAAGCDAFLAKPCTYEQLLDEVRRHMQRPSEPAPEGTVLLVEDDEDIRISVGEILREEGFTVAVCRRRRRGAALSAQRRRGATADPARSDDAGHGRLGVSRGAARRPAAGAPFPS